MRPFDKLIKMKQMSHFIKLIFLLSLVILPTPLFGSDVLTQIDVLDNLRFRSTASDGKHFIFTRYDNTGNKYELVFYDLREKKPVIIVPDLPSDAKYLFSDNKYIFIGRGNRFSPSYELIIVDREAPNQIKKIISQLGSIDFSVEEFTNLYSILKLCDRLRKDGFTLQNNTVNELNSLLKQVDLYSKVKQQKTQTPSDRLQYLKRLYDGYKDDNENENALKLLKRLNRTTLEEFYPQETPKSLQLKYEKTRDYELPVTGGLSFPVTQEIKQVFLLDKKIYVIHSVRYGSDICFIYDLLTFAPLSIIEMKESNEAYYYYVAANNIVGIGGQIITYDKDANLIHRTDNKLQCQLGLSGTIKDRLFFSDICGKLYEYDIKTHERKIMFDLGALDIRSGLHKFSSLNFDINDEGLLVAVHSNKESYPKLIDIKSGQLLKTLTVKNIPDFIMIDNGQLYFIFSDWLGKKSRIEIYAYDKSLLYADAFYEGNLKKAYENAIRSYREAKDFYKAIEILENADIQLMIKGTRQVAIADKINILNDYAYLLSLTYDRYKEAIPLLEQVIHLSKDRTSAYINIADVYYKLYKYEKPERETLQKAKDYYETYKRLMNERGATKNILKRHFIESGEKILAKELGITISGTNLSKLLLARDKIFEGGYVINGSLSLYVYNRDNYSLIRELEILKCCDSEQQDITSSSLAVKDNKLFVGIEYRYNDNKRPNLFIFDLKTLKNIEKTYKKTEDVEKKVLTPNISYIRDGNISYFDLSGKTFERIKGGYEINNKKYLITRSIPYKEKKFHIYNLHTLEVNSDIALLKERASFYLFDDVDKIALTYFTSPKTLIEIYDIKNKQRRNILSLENDGRSLGVYTPILRTFRHYLIIAHRRDIIFFDAKKVEIIEVMKNIIPEYNEKQSVEIKKHQKGKKIRIEKNNRIVGLLIDENKKRLLIFTKDGQYNSFIELDFLRN